jgi:polyhydroxybutyrate depolymerase
VDPSGAADSPEAVISVVDLASDEQPALRPTAPVSSTSTTVDGSLPPAATVTDVVEPSGGCGASFEGDVAVPSGRRALVRRPALDLPGPAVLILHGYTGTPESIERTSGMTRFATARGAVAVYPEGTPVANLGGSGWASGSARYSTSGVDDVAFLLEVLDILVRDHCVDGDRLMLAGESNGAAMAVRAACDDRLVGRLRLVGAVIPAVDAGVLEQCGPGGPVPLVVIATRGDATIDFDGTYPAGQVPLLGQEDWFGRFARQVNGCDPKDPERFPSDGAVRVVPRACIQPAVLHEVTGGAHTWPGGPQGTGGLDPGPFPTNQVLWSVAEMS